MKRKTKKLLRIVFTGLVLIILPYVFMYLYINERGKDLVIEKLSKKLNAEVRLNSLSFSFPMRLSMVGLETKGLKVGQATADLGIGNPFSGTLRLDRLYLNGAGITIDDSMISSSFFDGNLPLAQPVPQQAGLISSGKPEIKVFIKTLVLEDCALFLQSSKVKPALDLKIEGIDGTVRDFYYPALTRFYMDIISGIAVNKTAQKDVLQINGWIDWPNKAMDVLVKATEVDYFIFDPYYPPFWKTKNLELKEAFLSLDSKLVAENDRLLIDYTIRVDKINFVDSPEDPARTRNFQTVLSLFTHNGKPELRLRHVTTMSRPTFKVTFIGEGLLDQLKAIDEEESKDALNYYMNKSKDIVESGVDKFRSLTIDPPVKAVGSLFEEFFKNLQRITGKSYEKEEVAEDVVPEE